MRFQTRDGEILLAIYKNDGVVAKRHLKEMFWSNRTDRAMEVRLSKLYQEEYIIWPTRDQYKTNPISEPVCWLGWGGALFVAGKCGVIVEKPTGNNDYQLRKFKKELRDNGFRWVSEPPWSLLNHNLAVIDIKLAVQREVEHNPLLTLEQWIPESVFRAKPDVVEYSIKDREGMLRKRKKGVCPDASFLIIDEQRRAKGLVSGARFLLEMDMSTHDNLSFGRDKVLPGVAYVHNSQYKKRFGHKGGAWLVVVKGEGVRLRNLMRQTHKVAGDDSKLFYFTNFENIKNGNILTSPIWQQVNQDSSISLLK